jgi:FkbM family methyltransferase
MRYSLHKTLNKIFELVNLRIIKADRYFKLSHKVDELADLGLKNMIDLLGNSNLDDYQNLHQYSKSQIGQDLFALAILKGKSGGYFVEFGATDGIGLSNSYMLEKHFGWQGILAEPGRNWHSPLIQNRSCHIDLRCVSDKSGEFVEFVQSTSPELSTLRGFEKGDSNSRVLESSYLVETISLNDLLKEYNAPSIIDFLSIDTEGSEFIILNNFNFDNYRFRVIVSEHNFTSNREKVFELLTSAGYKRIWPEFTQFDDWYISPDLVDFQF